MYLLYQIETKKTIILYKKMGSVILDTTQKFMISYIQPLMDQQVLLNRIIYQAL